MGDPIRFRKKYVTPSRPWETQRISDEAKLVNTFGLKSKTELWKVEAELRKYRRLARQLIGARGPEADKKKKIIVEKLAKIGLLAITASLDDVLSLEIRDLLDRRIQSIVYKKGYATTAKEARQLITHGHIALYGKIHTTPGALIPKSAENDILYIGPARVKPQTEAEESPILVAEGTPSRKPVEESQEVE